MKEFDSIRTALDDGWTVGGRSNNGYFLFKHDGGKTITAEAKLKYHPEVDVINRDQEC